jgi:hypothetical protein
MTHEDKDMIQDSKNLLVVWELVYFSDNQHKEDLIL